MLKFLWGGGRKLQVFYFELKICYYLGMKRILSFIISIFMCGAITAAVFPVGNTYAACDSKTILGLRPWYDGLITSASDGSCVIQPQTDDDLPSFVWRIVLNVLADLSLIVGYAAIIFVIFGGYKYIMSTGEPNKVAASKLIITNALIGLIISVLATVIVNTIIAVVSTAAK